MKGGRAPSLGAPCWRSHRTRAIPGGAGRVADVSAIIPIAVTGSFGVSIFGEHGTTREALIEAADRAMYEAKRSGRNRVCRASREQEASRQDDWKDDRSTSASEGTMQRVLLTIAALHDRATAAHANRLLHLVTATARQLGQPEEEERLIGLAAQLHDIGNIGIPDAILQKPGALDAEEWAALLTQSGGVFEEVARQVPVKRSNPRLRGRMSRARVVSTRGALLSFTASWPTKLKRVA